MSKEIKIERIQSNILRELNLLFKNFLDSEIIPALTVHEVRLTNDLSIAKIFYSFIGNFSLGDVQTEIKNNLKEIRHQLAEKVDMKSVPELKFEYDKSLANANHIEEILNSINKTKN